MKSLGRPEDVESTKKALERAQSFFLSIPDQKTPWYLMGLDYADGYVHWYDVGQGARSVVCAGGLEGKGFATDDCPICSYVLELYQESKRLDNEGEAGKAKALKERANRIHAKASVQFKALRGQRVLVKTSTGKVWVADWDDEDDDTTVAAGIISLSEAQFDGLIGLIAGEDTPFIKSGDDLGKRILWTKKENRKGRQGGRYSAVVWDVDEKESDMPQLEVEQELLDMDLTANFAIDEEEVGKVYALLSGQEIEEVAEDEEVELEADSSEEDVPDNVDLDDLPDDDDEEIEEDEDDFQDDLPYDEDEEEEEEEPAPKKRTTGKPATVRKSTGKPATSKGKASSSVSKTGAKKTSTRSTTKGKTSSGKKRI